MQLKTRHIIARDRKQITFLLYGLIGEKIDGDYFAQELMYAEKEYDEIVIRINSDGGSVNQGLSIVSAMMSSKAFIIVQVDGVAASMAATLLPAADFVRMNDYARIMIHSPYYEDEEGNKVQNLSAKDKKSLESLKGIMVTLLSKRGKSEDDIKKLLRTDTWFDAKEAIEAGLVDEVVTTGKKELAAMAPKKLVAKLNDDEYQPKKAKPMKKVIARLGLPEDSNEEAVLKAMDKREQQLVDRHIEMAKDVITDDNKEMMAKLAKQDLDLFTGVVDQLRAAAKPAEEKDTGKEKDAGKEKDTGKDGKGAQARLSDLVKDAQGKKDPKAAKSFDWYQRHDPQALAKLKQDDPEKFEELYDEYEASL
jgi:ATP-dependent Clp endopeptidase proteolytic subunit ClpP